MVPIRFANRSPKSPVGLPTTSRRRPTGYTACTNLCSSGTVREHVLVAREPATITPAGPAVQTDERRRLLQHRRYGCAKTPASTNPGRNAICHGSQDSTAIDTGIDDKQKQSTGPATARSRVRSTTPASAGEITFSTSAIPAKRQSSPDAAALRRDAKAALIAESLIFHPFPNPRPPPILSHGLILRMEPNSVNHHESGF